MIFKVFSNSLGDENNNLVSTFSKKKTYLITKYEVKNSDWNLRKLKIKNNQTQILK